MQRTDSETFTWRGLVTSPHGWLAMSLLAVELLTGIQLFLANTTMPLIAADLRGHHLYGVATASAQVAIFLTMPLGASLMHRFTPAKLMVWLTPVTIGSAILGALSPNMWFFIGTRIIAGLAAGILATVGMGAIVTALPPSWRQRVLAANNIVWLISAIVGPLYAAAASHAFGWRWAMVLYLPLLLLARWVIARQLAQLSLPEEKRTKLPLVEAFVLSGGIALLTAMALNRPWAWALSVIGFIAIMMSTHRILPDGVMRLRRGSRSGLALLALLSIMVFSGDAIVTILAHDVLGFRQGKIGVLLGSMSIGWSITGLVCGKWPVTGKAFRIRGSIGVALLCCGLAGMAYTLHHRLGSAYIAAFFILGIGMGLVFLDALNIVFTPDEHDPLDPTDASAASVIVQQVAGATFMTLTTSAIAINPATGVWMLAGLALFGVPSVVTLWRASAQ